MARGGLVGSVVGHAVGEAARAIAENEASIRKRDPVWWWLTRSLFVLALVIGWIFIGWQNKFHFDAPVVVICLGYMAVMFAIANLWRVGAAAVLPSDAGEEAWSRPLGERGELEKEKKTLLKAIKEAEFDQAMGKLSKHDADELIRMYRARAIELIKELDRLDAGHALTPRERIEREVAARVAVEQDHGKGKKAAQQKAEAKKADEKAPEKAEAKPEAKPEETSEAKAEPKPEATADEPASTPTEEEPAATAQEASS